MSTCTIHGYVVSRCGMCVEIEAKELKRERDAALAKIERLTKRETALEDENEKYNKHFIEEMDDNARLRKERDEALKQCSAEGLLDVITGYGEFEPVPADVLERRSESATHVIKFIDALRGERDAYRKAVEESLAAGEAFLQYRCPVHPAWCPHSDRCSSPLCEADVLADKATNILSTVLGVKE